MLKIKESGIHGKGLFTAQFIKKGELIGIYRGKECKRDGVYVLWVDNIPHYIRNKLRYANHAKKPNAEVLDGFYLYAKRNIRSNEEITIHYGSDWK